MFREVFGDDCVLLDDEHSHLEGTVQEIWACHYYRGESCECYDCADNGCCNECVANKAVLEAYENDLIKRLPNMTLDDQVREYRFNRYDAVKKEVCEHHMSWRVIRVGEDCIYYNPNQDVARFLQYLNSIQDEVVCPAGYLNECNMPSVTYSLIDKVGDYKWYTEDGKECTITQCNAFGGLLKDTHGKIWQNLPAYKFFGSYSRAYTFAFVCGEEVVSKYYTISISGVHVSEKRAFRIVIDGKLKSTIRESGSELLSRATKEDKAYIIRYNTIWYICSLWPEKTDEELKSGFAAFNLATSYYVFHNNRCVTYCDNYGLAVRGRLHTDMLIRLGYSYNGRCWIRYKNIRSDYFKANKKKVYSNLIGA